MRVRVSTCVTRMGIKYELGIVYGPSVGSGLCVQLTVGNLTTVYVVY